MLDPTTMARMPMVDRLSPAARRALAARAVTRAYRAGEVLWTAGSAVDHLLIVIEGEVRVVRESGAGRQHVLHTEGPGGTLAEVPFYSAAPAPATAIATVPTRCLLLNRAAIEAAIDADPSVAWVLLDRLAARVRGLVERVDRLALQSVTTRLVGLLLARAEDAPDDGGAVATLGMSQAALAAELGTVREVVVRSLRSLRERKLIATAGRGRFRLVDVAGLRRVRPAMASRATSGEDTAKSPQ